MGTFFVIQDDLLDKSVQTPFKPSNSTKFPSSSGTPL